MTVGYYLSAKDNDSFYLDENSLGPLRCPKCGFLVDPIGYRNPFFKLKKKKFDLSYTYDQRAVASLKFKEFCQREEYADLVFYEFEREPNFFQFIALKKLELDIYKSNPRFEKKCEECGNWEGTYLNDIIIKDLTLELKDGFYRTDVLFSYGDRKNPLFIVAPSTYKKLTREKMTGLIFTPIYAGDPP